MPTTSNFGWTTPADTDLVKDGAAAIRTLGNGIDTSLVDLKGGTTGQVLSKNSNTDLDYTWVTPNVGDITEVQAGTGISVASGTGPIPVVTNTVATAYDAKGDLIVGTGADTFAKLTVGTNGHTLVADSATATGLKWAAGATSPSFIAWTPTWTNVTVGNGTVIAQYATDGDLVFGYIKLEWGSTTSQSGDAIFTLPVNCTNVSLMRWGFGVLTKGGEPAVMATLTFASTSQGQLRFLAQHAGTGTYVRDNDIGATTPITWNSGSTFGMTFWYRKA